MLGCAETTEKYNATQQRAKRNVGPNKPDGDKEKNWIQTKAGKAWFPYFMLYSPKQAFLDKTWVLPNIEKRIE